MRKDEKPLTKPDFGVDSVDVSQTNQFLGSHLFVPKRCRLVGYSRMECFRSLSVQRAKTSAEDEKPLTKPDFGVASVDVSQTNQFIGSRKDLNSLPKIPELLQVLERQKYMGLIFLLKECRISPIILLVF
ncbi:hypothetical protein POM88_032255 [Heracleum sosnowskyi]|uniref:Uncharacterized protein n=1 Tax=Heracleum sosnowskyi TaxID=360622 RepID=A0AAD8I0Y4_9APIA|nr:hypothetical protein POM88_032255 [Heracleum sosnowskyi]